MADAVHELPLESPMCDARICVRPGEDGGWDVSTEVDGRQIATDHCPTWQRVERFRDRMQGWLSRAQGLQMRMSSNG